MGADCQAERRLVLIATSGLVWGGNQGVRPLAWAHGIGASCTSRSQARRGSRVCTSINGRAEEGVLSFRAGHEGRHPPGAARFKKLNFRPPRACQCDWPGGPPTAWRQRCRPAVGNFICGLCRQPIANATARGNCGLHATELRLRRGSGLGNRSRNFTKDEPWSGPDWSCSRNFTDKSQSRGSVHKNNLNNFSNLQSILKTCRALARRLLYGGCSSSF